MIDKAREHCKDAMNVEILQEDVRLFEYENADMMVSYYCMQFIPPRDRQEIFNKVYKSLNWGGAFILFEKVRGPDARFQDITSKGRAVVDLAAERVKGAAGEDEGQEA